MSVVAALGNESILTNPQRLTCFVLNDSPPSEPPIWYASSSVTPITWRLCSALTCVHDPGLEQILP